MVKKLDDLEKMNKLSETIIVKFHNDVEKIGNLIHQKLMSEINNNFNNIPTEEKNIIYRYLLSSLKQEFAISFLCGIAFSKKL